jgi:aspartate-semialdehyde dehydrogenase
MVRVLEERNFPVGDLYLFSSERSEGATMTFKDREVEVLAEFEPLIDKIDIALFAVESGLAKEFAPKVRTHAVIIDNSNAYRLDPEVPLVVPEVNPEAIKDHRGLIANPNCSTIQMVVALYPLHRFSRIKRIFVATYQSVSGKGRVALEELQYENEQLAVGEEITKFEECVFPHAIAGNCIPEIDKFQENGYTLEETKMLYETRKIFGDDGIDVSATCVRVPVSVGHSEAVSVEFEKEISCEKALELLSEAPGVVVYKNPADYPVPAEVAGKDDIYVGRLRKDLVFKNGLAMWVVADNVRKGAATNAVQIAERLL